MDIEQLEHMDTGRGTSHTAFSSEGKWEGQHGWGGIMRREIPDIGDGGMKATNHLAMYVPMQQFCMICTCTPEPKVT